MFVLGLDLGYSNAKICFGDSTARSDELKTYVLPSTASPASKYSAPAFSGKSSNDSLEDGITVNHNNEEWVAFVDPARLSYYTRELDAQFHCSDAYQAMFKAAISLTGRDSIDMLVIGLPDAIYQNQSVRTTLEASLQGAHIVAKGKTVRVHQVSVISQPLGGYMQLVMQAGKDQNLEHLMLQSKTLIVDPGFFSFDWITLERGAYIEGARGTSTRATSVFLESVCRSIEKETGAKPTVAQLEHAMRSGWDTVFVSGKQIDISKHFSAGIEDAAVNAVSEMSASLRQISGTSGIGIVMLVGGGAKLFEPALRKLLADQRFVVPKEPVLANAIGFYLHGRHKAAKASAA